MDDLDLAGLGPDDPLRSVLDALQQELVVPPSPDTRSAHLAAMSTTIPGASGWALRFRRARIRQALVGAGLQVALVSTAAAAGVGALAVPGDLLPPSVQRAVSAAGSVFGLELPSPDDTPAPAEVDETEDDRPDDDTEPPGDQGSEEPAVTGTEEPSTPPTADDEPGDDQGEDRDDDGEDDRDDDGDDDREEPSDDESESDDDEVDDDESDDEVDDDESEQEDDDEAESDDD